MASQRLLSRFLCAILSSSRVASLFVPLVFLTVWCSRSFGQTLGVSSPDGTYVGTTLERYGNMAVQFLVDMGRDGYKAQKYAT